MSKRKRISQPRRAKRKTTSSTCAKAAVEIERATIGLLVSREARKVTPLMSKVYLALLLAPAEYWDHRGVLHFTGEQHRREWRTAWQQLLEVTGVASATVNKALEWMRKEKIISYYAGRNGYGIHIVFNKDVE